MKKLALSVATVVAMSSLVFAGGDVESVIEPKMTIPEPTRVVETPMEVESEGGFYVGIAYAYAMEKERAGFAPSGIVASDDPTWEVAGYGTSWIPNQRKLCC